jgi:hypothetical protein
LIELATGDQDPDEMDEDDANERPLFLLVKANAMKCLGLAWSKKKEVQGKKLFIILITLLTRSNFTAALHSKIF